MKLLRLIGIVAMAGMIQGCGAKLDLWGAKIDFPEGLDAGVKLNAIDTVDDRRGVNSKEGNYVQKRARQLTN